jgi:hypothetical protein
MNQDGQTEIIAPLSMRISTMRDRRREFGITDFVVMGAL